MLECLILGDSIAKGVSDVRKECVSYVKSGITSSNWVKQYSHHAPFEAKTVIISLGSNDYDNATEKSLRKLRANINENQVVYWILPNIKDSIRKTVWMIAKDNEDIVLDARQYDRSADHVHPTYKGYKEIAQATK